MKFFEVFKAGKYPQGDFSEDDVETLAKNYEPEFCEAPITLDHEQKGPAYGWVSELKSENGKLKASFRNVSPELKDFVQSGKYKKISIEIYKELEGKKPYLKAVSFLGACIPQVKGMEPIEFKNGETEIYIFEIEEEPEIKINEELVKLQNQLSELESQVVLFIDKPNKNEYSELVSALQEKVQNMSTQISKMQDESILRQKVEFELSKLKQEIREKEIEQFLNEQITLGQLSQAQKDSTLKILTALDNVKKFDESDYMEEFKQFITTFPKQYNNFEVVTKSRLKNNYKVVEGFLNADEDSLAVYNEAKQTAERDNISFKDALLKLYE